MNCLWSAQPVTLDRAGLSSGPRSASPRRLAPTEDRTGNALRRHVLRGGEMGGRRGGGPTYAVGKGDGEAPPGPSNAATAGSRTAARRRRSWGHLGWPSSGGPPSFGLGRGGWGNGTDNPPARTESDKGVWPRGIVDVSLDLTSVENPKLLTALDIRCPPALGLGLLTFGLL